MHIVLVLAALVLLILFKGVHKLYEYERGVLYTWGRLSPRLRGPGLVLIVPFWQELKRVDQRVVALDVPAQDVITRDNISIQVSAVLYSQVIDPLRALNEVENFSFASSQFAQTTLRTVCGEASLDDLLQKRDELNQRIREIVDQRTEPWGVKVSSVEIKHIDLPQEMQRAMAKQAEAERDRRAKVIQAEGELQAAGTLSQAAKIMAEQPTTIVLRYLETLKTIAGENNSTIVFPLPIDIFDRLRSIK